MSKKEAVKVPHNACCLDMPDEGLFAFSETDAESDIPSKVKINCYSGQIIPDHWWWGNLVIDLAGMSFPKTSCPILWEHDTDRIVGMSKKPTVTDKFTLVIEEGTLLDTPDGENVAKLSKQKFPFQASIRATPTKIERVEEKQSVEVNGQKMEGPLTIWRKSTYKETSVCVFGYDSNTDAKAFAENKETENFFTLEVDSMPSKTPFDLEAFKAENPEAFSAISAAVAAPLSTEAKETADKLSAVTAELATAKTALAAATAQAEALSTENKTTIDRLSRLEKDAAIRHENDLRTAFSTIIQGELAKGDIPAALHSKVGACLNLEQFVEGEGRVLNTEKAKAAAAAEVAEWKTAFASPSILGGGGSLSASPVSDTQEDEKAINAFADSVAATAKVGAEGQSTILGF